MVYLCKRCHHKFDSKTSYDYHKSNVKCELIHKCDDCDIVFRDTQNLKDI